MKDEDKKPVSHKWWLPAIIVLVGLVARWGFGENKPTPQQLYAIFAVHDFEHTGTGAIDELQQKAEVLLKAKNEAIRGCVLKGHDLAGADFSGQDLSGCKFTGCNLCDADFSGANLSFANLSNCVLRRAIFSGATLTKADMSDNVMDVAKFVGCTAIGTLFRHSKMNGADMMKGNFSDADFFFAEVRANFNNASLVSANLFGADLTQADFTQADLRKAVMTDAKIARAIFTYAKMEGSIGTNGRPWGFTVKPKEKKQPWWKVWNNAAL